MTDEEVISWMFLAVQMGSQVEPVNFQGISDMADGINHAIPTHKELQTSVKWLLKNNLIVKVTNKTYTMSEKGNAVYSKAILKGNDLFSIWNNLELEIRNIGL